MTTAPESLALLADEAASCTACGLAEGRTQVVFGTGAPDADVVFVGEAPGAREDEQGVPFVGRSGQLLDRLLAEELGVERSDVYIANVVKCRPPDNRDPRPDEIAACRPWLAHQLDLVDPAVIVTLGNFASRLLLDTATGITKLRGAEYCYGNPPRYLVPTFHPAAALRGGAAVLADMRSDFGRARSLMMAA
ncbi:MAG: uracil-DNA glycosylase [Acidimicrobiaceae bacterium]|nr:uracil-DNA glycosylase [Acidimicrobiaceae bacterium]